MRRIAREVNSADAAKPARTIADVASIIRTAGALTAAMKATAARAPNRMASAGAWSLLAVRLALGKSASTAANGGDR